MIIMVRSNKTQFVPQLNHVVAVDVRIYICDWKGEDGERCPVAQEEGHAPEDKDHIPRGWSVRFDEGGPDTARKPIFCPNHTPDDLAGRKLEMRHDVPPLETAREMPKLNGRS